MDNLHNKLIKGKIKITPIKLKNKCMKAVCFANLLWGKLDIIVVIQVPRFIPNIIDTAEYKDIVLPLARVCKIAIPVLLLCKIDIVKNPSKIPSNGTLPNSFNTS